MRPVVTPAEMGEADRRTISAGTPEAVLVERAGGAVAAARAAHARRRVRAPGRRGVRPGQQRRRRRGRGAAACARAASASTSSRSPTGRRRRRCAARSARADLAIDAMFGTGFRGALDGDAALVARAFAASRRPDARDRHPVGGRRHDRRGARRRGARATRRCASPRSKPGLLFEPGRAPRGPRARRRHRHRRAGRGRHRAAARARGRRPRPAARARPTGTSGRRACSSSAGRRA